MAKLLREMNIAVYGNTRQLKFTTTEDITNWLDAEEPFWKGVDLKGIDANFVNHWSAQAAQLGNIRTHVRNYEELLSRDEPPQLLEQTHIALSSTFSGVHSGVLITSDSDIYPSIVDLASKNVSAAALALLAARPDSDSTLGRFGNNLSISAFIRLILTVGRSNGTKDWLQPHRKELASLKNTYQSELGSLRGVRDENAEKLSALHGSAALAEEERGGQWSAQAKRFEEEWAELKRVYDEKLALLAPTQYWNARAETHRTQAFVFAALFVVVIGATLWVFVSLAMPHLLLAASDKNISPLLSLIPVAVPAFAAVWVLKMLSRLLSENLQMMRDARERETMVKTFLALMRDDERGKALVRDDDRILILHALFRPSSVSAIDDAPPVHWFDILTNKVGKQGRP